MSDEERKPSSSIIKFLLIGVAILLIIILTVFVTLYTVKYIGPKDVVEVTDTDKVVVDNLELDEITAFTLKNNEKGMIKFKLNIEVNDVKVKEFLSTKKFLISDTLISSLMLFNIKEAMLAYQSKELHKAIVEELNKIIGNNIKVDKPLVGDSKNKKFMVVKVNIANFSAVVLD